MSDASDQRLSEEEQRRSNALDQTKLRKTFDAETQLPIVYHQIYDISFFGLEKCHPFDAGKWGRIITYTEEGGLLPLGRRSLIAPNEATDTDLRIVHTKSYLNSLKWSANVARVMEVPFVACAPNFLVQRYALRNFRYQTGGTVAAAFLAVEHCGWAINVGGGFHHCSAGRGGGFCAYADISIAITFLFEAKLIEKAMIVDLDAHQGNGHERDFVNDDRVFIFDMYNADIYPGDAKAKRGISKEIALHCGCSNKEYLGLLRRNLGVCLDDFAPDFVLYNAGTDCLIGDPLGAMKVTAQGILERDEHVWRECRSRDVPICMVTSGGYQRNNARIIADSLVNLRAKRLLALRNTQTRSTTPHELQ